MTTEQSSVSTDQTLQLLASEQRRDILRHLVENGDKPVAVDSIATVVSDDTRSDGGSPGPGPVETRLYHQHLPKLADAGVVEFDRQSDTVRYDPDDDVEALLQFVSDSLE